MVKLICLSEFSTMSGDDRHLNVDGLLRNGLLTVGESSLGAVTVATLLGIRLGAAAILYALIFGLTDASFDWFSDTIVSDLLQENREISLRQISIILFANHFNIN